jgi:hypothetical protein
MGAFDSKAFALGLVQPLRDAAAPHLADIGDALGEWNDRVDMLEKDITLTLRAMQAHTDPGSLKSLQDDLTRIMPARRDALMAILVSRLSSDAQATFDAILTVVVKAAVIAAKAFVPIP